MSKRVSRLLGLEIDEVSLVDRPANQHGLVTITKRDEDPVDEIYDAEGNLLDPENLQPGDVFYAVDESGELAEFEAVPADQDDDFQVPDDLSQEEYEDELAGVGKSAASAITGGAHSAFQTGRKTATRLLGDLRGGYGHGRAGHPTTVYMENGRGSDSARKLGAHAGRNRNAYAAGGGSGAVGFAAGRRKTTTAKSLGAEVLTELSKAYTDGDRDQIVSKAIAQADSRASAAERRAQIAISKAQAIEDQREYEQYVELAKSYELPVDVNDLGEILQTIAKSGLSDEQLDTVDRIFLAAAETRIYDEVGAGGIAPSSVEEVVKAQAYELVGKNDLTVEQATVALYENNDRAYLEYLAETGH